MKSEECLSITTLALLIKASVQMSIESICLLCRIGNDKTVYSKFQIVSLVDFDINISVAHITLIEGHVLRGRVDEQEEPVNIPVDRCI
jgi:hypothetical protein